MTLVENPETSRQWVKAFRPWVWLTGVVIWVTALAPPFSTWAHHYQFAQAIQFGLFAFCVPTMLIAGAQWRRLGLSEFDTVQIGPDGAHVEARRFKTIDRVALRRTGPTHQQRSVQVAIVFTALTIFWRVAPVVNFVVRHNWLTLIESLSLVATGALLFSDLIESPPVTPATTRPYRIGISAGVMWSAWVVSYLSAMSHAPWYSVFRHVAGHGLSLATDQQLSAGFTWFISGVVFVPIIFWNLIQWLQSDEDPNEEMGKLLREERTRRFFGTD